MAEFADLLTGAVARHALAQLAGDLGGIPMIAALTAHAQASEALLGADMREPVRSRLQLALSDAHRAAGHAAVSAGLRATVAFTSAVEGTKHAVGCSVDNFGHLAAAQLRCGELRSGLHTAQQAIGLAKDLRSVSVVARLAPLQEAAATCQDLARELATLRSAA